MLPPKELNDPLISVECLSRERFCFCLFPSSPFCSILMIVSGCDKKSMDTCVVRQAPKEELSPKKSIYNTRVSSAVRTTRIFYLLMFGMQPRIKKVASASFVGESLLSTAPLASNSNEMMFPMRQRSTNNTGRCVSNREGKCGVSNRNRNSRPLSTWGKREISCDNAVSRGRGARMQR